MPVEISAEMQQSNMEKRHISKQAREPFLIEGRGAVDRKGKVKAGFLGCRSADIITMTAARRRSTQ
jgi:hypothetical protein